MPEKEETDSNRNNDRTRFSLPKAILTLVAILLAAVALLLLIGPRSEPSSRIILDKAFVHGAVTNVGIDEDARISELNVELGAVVEAGDIIATLDAHAVAADVAGEEAKLQRLRSELAEAQVDRRLDQRAAKAAVQEASANVSVAEAQRDSAQADLDMTQAELDRTRQLVEGNVVSRADLDQAIAAAERARAEVERREAELTAARSDLTEAEILVLRDEQRAAKIDTLRARIAEAEADLQVAQTALSKTQVPARTGGIVVDVASRAGASIRPGDTIVTTWDTDRIWMQAWISEKEVAAIKIGTTAQVKIDALPGQVFEGQVRRVLISEDGRERTLPGQPISPLLPEEGRFALQVSFAPDDAALAEILPGMSGTVAITRTKPRKGFVGLDGIFSLMKSRWWS